MMMKADTLMMLMKGVGDVPKLSEIDKAEEWLVLFECFLYHYSKLVWFLFVQVVHGKPGIELVRDYLEAVEDGSPWSGRIDVNVSLYHCLAVAIVGGPAAVCLREENLYRGGRLLESLVRKIRGIGVLTCHGDTYSNTV